MFGQTYYALMRNALAGGGWQAAVENSRRAGMNKVRIKAEDAWSADVRPGRGKYVRALSVHQQTRQDFQFFDQTWLSHAIVQLGVRNQGKTFRDGNEWEANKAAEEGRAFRNGDEWGNYSIVLNYGRRMPVVNDEYGYIGEPEDQSVPKGAEGKYPRYPRAKHRQTMWGIYAGGGYAAAGDKYDYEDGRPYFSSNWHDTEEYGDIKRLIDVFTTKGVEYWRMAPRNEMVKSGERVYVLAEPGKQYVIYAAAGGSFSVELARGSYEARRYDPRTGEDIALKQSKGGVESFTLPDKQDWVIYLRARSAAPPTRSQQAKQNHEKVIFDVDLTKGNAGTGKVTGGVWERGWRVTGADHERIVFDAGRPIASGYLEVSFTASQSPVTEPPRKINYFGLHEDASLSQNKHEGDIL